jgi:hypothetical protein
MGNPSAGDISGNARQANMSTAVSGSDRVTLSALADRLVYGNPETFDPEDARELARLLPVPKRRHFLSGRLPGLIVRGSFPSMSGSGFAAGVGNVSLRGEDISFDFDSRGRRLIRAGQWKIYRYPSAIGIEQVMADDCDDARATLLEFRRGEPTRMLLLVQAELSIGPIGIGFGRFTPWKVPA